MNIQKTLKLAVKRFLTYLGYEVRRIQPQVVVANSLSQISEASRLYVGCGEDTKPGFIGCDIRPLSTVQLVCAAWEVSSFTRNAKEIFSRHTLEHLTNAEARAALSDWYDALGAGGILHIIVPDMDFHINQWLNADWETSNKADPKSNACWGFAGFYGWQRECDPKEPTYNQTYWDVHKSGYNGARMKCLVEEAGFEKIDISSFDSCHLIVIASKPAL